MYTLDGRMRDEEFYYRLSTIIDYVEATDESSWCVDVVKTKAGKNCLFGHLWDMVGGDQDKVKGNEIFDWFESRVSTTFFVYRVNDGENPDYPQNTPKQRCLELLRNIFNGCELTTYESMDKGMLLKYKHAGEVAEANRFMSWEGSYNGLFY